LSRSGRGVFPQASTRRTSPSRTVAAVSKRDSISRSALSHSKCNRGLSFIPIGVRKNEDARASGCSNPVSPPRNSHSPLSSGGHTRLIALGRSPMRTLSITGPSTCCQPRSRTLQPKRKFKLAWTVPNIFHIVSISAARNRKQPAPPILRKTKSVSPTVIFPQSKVSVCLPKNGLSSFIVDPRPATHNGQGSKTPVNWTTSGWDAGCNSVRLLRTVIFSQGRIQSVHSQTEMCFQFSPVLISTLLPSSETQTISLPGLHCSESGSLSVIALNIGKSSPLQQTRPLPVSREPFDSTISICGSTK